MNKQHLRIAAAAGLGVAAVAILAACAASSARRPEAPVPLAGNVDIPRFMGSWYVIANIPTFPEKGARRSVETYSLASDGTVDIDFRYLKPDGDMKQMGSRGFVSADNPAVWGVQFVWPIKADYRISYVSPDYSSTIVARDKRDYVWIMARKPVISEAEYSELLAKVVAMGYDGSKLQRVEQGF